MLTRKAIIQYNNALVREDLPLPTLEKMYGSIVEAIPDLAYASDCIGNEISTSVSAEPIGTKKDAVICTVRPGEAFPEGVPQNVKVTDVLVFMAFSKPHIHKKVKKWPGRAPWTLDVRVDGGSTNLLETHHEGHALSREIYEKIGEWIDKGELTPQKPKDMGVLSVKSLKKAMEMNRKGKVLSEKLVSSSWTPCSRSWDNLLKTYDVESN